MSKERALRRAEREREAAVVAAARAAEAERRERREARLRAVTSRLPRRRPRQRGVLVERRRKQVWATAALLLLANVLVFAFSHDWAARALALAITPLAAPVLYTLLFRRRT
jgi:Flp pilus assembly protein TadB